MHLKANRNRYLGVCAGLYFVVLWSPSWFTTHYAYFIDEFYFIACATRPALGYVDHPPLAAWLLAASGAVLGYSLPALRFLPCLAGAAVVVVAGLLTRRLGGGPRAEMLAVLATALSPLLTIMSGYYSMNAFEILFWALCSYLVLIIIQTGNPRLWVVFGAVAGLALLNKHTLVLYAIGLGVGLLLSRDRGYLLSPWLWCGAFLAGVLFLPNIIWQVAHDWPSLEFYRNAAANKNQPAAPWTVVLQQLLFTNPGSAIVWVGGLLYFFRERSGQLRVFGWMYLTLLAILVVSQQSRPDRIAGIYPLLLAAGAVFWTSRWAIRPTAWSRWALPAVIVLFALVFAPIALPVLPPRDGGCLRLDPRNRASDRTRIGKSYPTPSVVCRPTRLARIRGRC